MFAYRHAFHAGNHADVLKHIALIQAIELLQKKEGALLCVDTHAGAGLYALKSALVRDKAEWPTGIGKLWGHAQTAATPAAVARYLAVIQQFNRGTQLTRYPGSPVIMQTLLRAQDKLRAFEMHPTDIGPLQSSLKGSPRQVKAERKDGFAQLRALLPPMSRRGLILIDPPYELRDDYKKVVLAVKEAMARFATGVYMIWYPQIARFQVERMLRQLSALQANDTLHVSLTVRGPQSDGLGLQGSGLVILNPPFGLEDALKKTLPWLVQTLGQDRHAGFDVTPSF